MAFVHVRWPGGRVELEPTVIVQWPGLAPPGANVVGSTLRHPETFLHSRRANN